MKQKLLYIVVIFMVASCGKKQEVDVDDYAYKSRIAMQRVKDTDPLAKQDLVSREAVQYAMLDKMNQREQRLQREFNRVQDKREKQFKSIQNEQEQRFLTAYENNNERFENLAAKIEENTITSKNISEHFANTVDDLEATNQKQEQAFIKMTEVYQERLDYDYKQDEIRRERENSIRGVVENMYADQQKATESFFQSVAEGMLPPAQWVTLQDAEISLHVEDDSLEELMLRAIKHAGVNAGPWQLKWKLKRQNAELLQTRFSLDAESTFGEFIDYVKGYIVNYNGVVLKFRIFKDKRMLMISDT